MCGSGTRAERVATGSGDRIRLSRAPHTKYKFLLGRGVESMGRALERCRRVAKDADSSSARAVAQELEFFREALRFLANPFSCRPIL